MYISTIFSPIWCTRSFTPFIATPNHMLAEMLMVLTYEFK